MPAPYTLTLAPQIGVELDTIPTDQVKLTLLPVIQGVKGDKGDVVDLNAGTGITIDYATATLAVDPLVVATQTDVASRVRFDAAQTLTTPQQDQARSNIFAEKAGVAATLVASVTTSSIGAATAAQGTKADTAIQSADLAPVALSGSFSDLINKSSLFNLVYSAYVIGSNVGILATDTLGEMLGKLQSQVNAKEPAIAVDLVTKFWSGTKTFRDLATDVRAVVLTGLSTATGTAITAADSVLSALGKLQNQASANATAITGKEPTIATTGTSGQFWAYDKTWQTPVVAAAPDPYVTQSSSYQFGGL